MFGRTRESVLVTRSDLERNRDTFLRLLDQTGILSKIETDEQRVIHNWGINILENAGGTQEMNRYKLLNAIIDTILGSDIPESVYSGRENGRR